MSRFYRTSAIAVIAALSVLTFNGADAADHQVARGKYLTDVIGCGDCHTPGYFLGKPDQMRYLAGSDVGFAIPKLGVFVPPNLTPDPETGLGQWSTEQIVAAITTGKGPDGRVLAPAMPWRAFAQLSPSDARAVASYLKSLLPIRHAVPGLFGPGAKVDVFVLSVSPPDVYNSVASEPQ